MAMGTDTFGEPETPRHEDGTPVIVGGTEAGTDSEAPAGAGERVQEVIAMPSLDKHGNETHQADAVVVGRRPRAEVERAGEHVELASVDNTDLERR